MVAVAVFGCGSFGSALAFKVGQNGHDVRILARREAAVESINKNRRVDKYLVNAKYEFPPNVRATLSKEECLEGVEFIIHTVPVQESKSFLSSLAPLIPPHAILVNASKGLVSDTLETMSDVIPCALMRDQPCAFLSGPSFAKELVENVPSALVCASKDEETAKKVQNLFQNNEMRIYLSKDIVGVEVGGALKNVFAIGVGIAEGMGLGQNTAAALVTRGCAEMMRLATAMGGHPLTLSGLAGIGDMILTCFGALSRNKSVGLRLGRGETLEDIKKSMDEVAEGVATSPAALLLSERYGLDLPIVRAVAMVVGGSVPPREAVELLLSLPVAEEVPMEIFNAKLDESVIGGEGI